VLTSPCFWEQMEQAQEFETPGAARATATAAARAAAAANEQPAAPPSDASRKQSRSPFPPGSVPSPALSKGYLALTLALSVAALFTCQWWRVVEWRLMFAGAAGWNIAAGWYVCDLLFAASRQVLRAGWVHGRACLSDPVKAIRSMYGAYAKAHWDDIWDDATSDEGHNRSSRARPVAGRDSAVQPPLEQGAERLRWDLPHTGFVFALVAQYMCGGAYCYLAIMLPRVVWPSFPFVLAIICCILVKCYVLVTRLMWAIAHRYWTQSTVTSTIVDATILVLFTLSLLWQKQVAVIDLLQQTVA
jgi:hypothetical protein